MVHLLIELLTKISISYNNFFTGLCIYDTQISVTTILLSAKSANFMHFGRHIYMFFVFLVPTPLSMSIREGLKKNKKQMVGLIHRGWLAGVSMGPTSNQKNYCFVEKIRRWSELSNSSRKLKTLIFQYWGGQGRNPGYLTSTFSTKTF